MSLVAVYLLLIAIFQNGIEANNSTEISPESPAKTENASSTEPANKEEAAVSKTTKEKTPDVAEAKEEKKDKTQKAQHEKKSTTATDIPKSTSSKSPIERVKPSSGFDFSGKILQPVMIARSKISDAVSKGMDGAKDMADGAFNFFRDTVTSFF